VSCCRLSHVEQCVHQFMSKFFSFNLGNYYTNTVNGNSFCAVCDSTCATCSGGTSSTCLTCPPGRYLSNNSCLACDSTCATCVTSATNCLSCSVVLYQNTCLSDCPSGFYASLVGGINTCLACDSSCSTCKNLATNCMSCAAGKYLSGLTCLSCSSSCSTCTGTSTSCLTCPSNFIFYEFSCVTSCPSGYYLSTISS
jgi:hypothetical protein